MLVLVLVWVCVPTFVREISKNCIGSICRIVFKLPNFLKLELTQNTILSFSLSINLFDKN